MQNTQICKQDGNSIDFSFDGCSVSATSAQDISEGPLNAVRGILLSAYKPRQTGDILVPNPAKWDNIGRSNGLPEP